MSKQPLTKAEREELRRLNDAASPAPWFVFKMDGYPNVVSYTVPHNGETLRGEIPADDADDELIAAARNALPRLLADLDAAEAKVYDLKSRICRLDCRYTMGDVADISGSHCTEPCARCLADRDRIEAEAERDRAEAERDALKAKLAAVEEERDTQATTLVDERDRAKAKLAALVEVGERWVTSNEPIDAGNPFVDHDLKAAIAAARGGAQ